jgi:hypothetical protein
VTRAAAGGELRRRSRNEPAGMRRPNALHLLRPRYGESSEPRSRPWVTEPMWRSPGNQRIEIGEDSPKRRARPSGFQTAGSRPSKYASSRGKGRRECRRPTSRGFEFEPDLNLGDRFVGVSVILSAARPAGRAPSEAILAILMEHETKASEVVELAQAPTCPRPTTARRWRHTRRLRPVGAGRLGPCGGWRARRARGSAGRTLVRRQPSRSTRRQHRRHDMSRDLLIARETAFELLNHAILSDRDDRARTG